MVMEWRKLPNVYETMAYSQHECVIVLESEEVR